MHRAIGIALALLAAAAPAHAELEPPRAGARAVAGIVVDARTGAPIAGAAVSAGADAATSGSDGRFTLPAAAGSEVFVMANGYLPTTVRIPDSGDVAIALSTELADAGEIIEVTGTAPDPVRTTSYRLDADQVRSLPGASNDVLRAVQMVPGVTRMSYGLGGLILRGARSNDTQVFVDGIEVPLAFHIGGLASIYPSLLLEQLTVTPSGGDVSRGGGIGGLVEITSRPGRTDRWRVGGEVSFLDAGATAEGPLPAGGGVALGFRRSYAGEVYEALAPSDLRANPVYADAQLRLDQPLAGGTLTAIGLYSTDRITRGDELDVEQAFARAGLRYRLRIDDLELTALAWAGWRAFSVAVDGLDGDLEASTLQRQSMQPSGLRLEARSETSWGHIALGVDAEHTRYGEALARDDDEDETTPPHAMSQAGAWAEARWRIAGGKLNLKPGLRADYLSGSQAWVVEPRGTVSHELTSWLTLREGLSLHHQPPAPMNVVDDDGHRVVVAPARAIHGSVGADLDLPGDVAASLTLYQTQSEGPEMPSDSLTELIRDIAGIGVVIENLVGNDLGNSGGRGRSRGLELAVERRSERWLLWLGYTLARSEHYDGGAVGWQVTTLDQTHTVNAVASASLGAWRVGLRGRYATGLPAFRLDLSIDDDDEDLVLVHRGRMRDFASLDVRIDRSWRRSWGTLSVFLDVQNVTNRANQEFMAGDEDDAEPVPGLPVFPTFGVSLVPPP